VFRPEGEKGKIDGVDGGQEGPESVYLGHVIGDYGEDVGSCNCHCAEQEWPLESRGN
jgi:hypothetical protein